MDLPANLKWIEVDLPEILAYKEEVLDSGCAELPAGESPTRSIERLVAPRVV